MVSVRLLDLFKLFQWVTHKLNTSNLFFGTMTSDKHERVLVAVHPE